jgi:cysteine desulfuration protein SufE
MVEALEQFLEEFDFLDKDDRWRAVIDLGRALEPMPDALKTDNTKVRGCASSVWVYPVPSEGDRLHFFADSNSEITKGIIALILMIVQDRAAEEILFARIEDDLAPFNLSANFSSNRTQGIPNMIALIRATAARQS